MTPRGIRNNNPFNLEYNPSTHWGGLDSPPSDGRFCRFTTPVFGIRAACKLLLTYQAKYGLDTVLTLMNRFAPPAENDTGSYAYNVARYAGVGMNAPVDLRGADAMRLVARAMIRQENGQQPYPDAVIDEAMALAGIKPSQPTNQGDRP